MQCEYVLALLCCSCEYSWARHPRFGRVRAVRAVRAVAAGEELLTDYRYSYSKAPAWYRDSLRQFLTINFNLEEAEIAEFISKMETKKQR